MHEDHRLDGGKTTKKKQEESPKYQNAYQLMTSTFILRRFFQFQSVLLVQLSNLAEECKKLCQMFPKYKCLLPFVLVR